jgi:hypothetical protein
VRDWKRIAAADVDADVAVVGDRDESGGQEAVRGAHLLLEGLARLEGDEELLGDEERVLDGEGNRPLPLAREEAVERAAGDVLDAGERVVFDDSEDGALGDGGSADLLEVLGGRLHRRDEGAEVDAGPLEDADEQERRQVGSGGRPGPVDVAERVGAEVARQDVGTEEPGDGAAAAHLRSASG